MERLLSDYIIALSRQQIKSFSMGFQKAKLDVYTINFIVTGLNCL